MTKMLQIDKEYAAALFELAAEENKTEEYLKELRGIKEIISENPEYLEFLGSPALALSERLDAIDSAFSSQVNEYTLSFLKLLCENGRIRVLESCIDEFAKLCMFVSNTAEATVFSAVELSSQQRERVVAKLEKVIGKSIKPTYIIDESLIGGLKVEVEGKTFDGSIKHRLLEVKEGIV